MRISQSYEPCLLYLKFKGKVVTKHKFSGLYLNQKSTLVNMIGLSRAFESGVKTNDYAIPFTVRLPHDSLSSFFQIKVDANGALLNSAKIQYKFKAKLVKMSDQKLQLSAKSYIIVQGPPSQRNFLSKEIEAYNIMKMSKGKMRIDCQLEKQSL